MSRFAKVWFVTGMIVAVVVLLSSPYWLPAQQVERVPYQAQGFVVLQRTVDTTLRIACYSHPSGSLDCVKY